MELIIIAIISFAFGSIWRNYVNYRNQTETTKLLHDMRRWLDSYIANTQEEAIYPGAEDLARSLANILSPRTVLWQNEKSKKY